MIAFSKCFRFSIWLSFLTFFNSPAWASDIDGEWVGAILSQTGTTNNNLSVSVSGGKKGQTKYLDLDCEGELTLQKERKGTYYFKEKIVSGAENCTNDAIITLELKPQGKLEYIWHFPNGRPGLQAELLKGNLASKNNYTAQKNNNSVQHNSATSPDEDKELALRYLEDMAAHPDDPQNPAGVDGVTDDELSNTAFEDIEELFAVTYSYVYQEPIEPRHLFALGRTAFLHDDDETAKELLTDAASRGSAAAEAYLARMLDDDALEGMKEHLQKAVAGGFSPAKEWLAEVNQLIEDENQNQIQAQYATVQNNTVDFNRFNQPELIKAFYNQNASNIDASELAILTYSMAFNDVLLDTKGALFLTSNPAIVTEHDPNLSVLINRKFISSNAMAQGMNMGMQNMTNFLQAWAGAHKNNSSPQQGVQDMMNALINTPSSTTNLVALQNQATQDATYLISLYDSNPDFLRRVYKGIRKYVYEL